MLQISLVMKRDFRTITGGTNLGIKNVGPRFQLSSWGVYFPSSESHLPQRRQISSGLRWSPRLCKNLSTPCWTRELNPVPEADRLCPELWVSSPNRGFQPRQLTSIGSIEHWSIGWTKMIIYLILNGRYLSLCFSQTDVCVLGRSIENICLMTNWSLGFSD